MAPILDESAAAKTVRRATRREQRTIAADLDRILRLYLLGILTVRERASALRRWAKHYELVLSDETRKNMGIGRAARRRKR